MSNELVNLLAPPHVFFVYPFGLLRSFIAAELPTIREKSASQRGEDAQTTNGVSTGTLRARCRNNIEAPDVPVTLHAPPFS